MAITVSGAVVDSESSEPLAGATILETGTNNYTIADANGAFTLDKVNDSSTLTIQYVTYKDKTIKAESTVGTIKLESDTILDEVVVTTSNIGKPCGQSVLPANATAGTWQKDSNDKTICVVSECATGYKVNKKTNTCFKSEPCSNLQILAKIGAKTGHTDIDETGNITCIIDECDPGYEKTKDNKCESISDKPCKKLPAHAKEGMRGLDASKNEVCFVTKCADKYVPSDNGTECVLSEGECSAAELQQIANATKGEKLKGVCKATECKDDYKVKNGKCVSKNGDECTASDTNAIKAKYKNINNKLQCIITECKSGYMPNDNGTACEVSEGPCKPDQVKAIEHATKGELKKGVCHATECESGYEPAGGKCTAIGGKCSNMPKNAKTAHREYDTAAGAEVCIVDACDDGCRRSDDKKSCNCPKLSEEDSQKKIGELKENAQAMKDKEQSLTARLTSGAAIGGMGIGGMQALSAVAEQKADADAEQDMAAYLATFRCDFGQGRNIKGGEKQIELPGANSLFQLNQEYKSLAADLKVRKESLELRPGIEAEHIDDKATTGLYDDVSLGRADGAFTSIARALSDEASDDAAEWAAQKADTKKKLKTGAIVAGVGAAVGIAGNIAVAATGPKNQTNAINAKYDKLKKFAEEMQKEQAAMPAKKCSTFNGTTNTGDAPNCTCTDQNARFFPDGDGCITCDGGKQYNASNECACPADKPIEENGVCIARPAGCTKTGYVNTETCQCIENAHEVEKACVCNANSHYEDGQCKKTEFTPTLATGDDDFDDPIAQVVQQIIPNQKVFEFNFDADKLFASGKSTISGNADTFINSFNQKLTGALQQDGIDLTQIEYCVTVTGHTDRTQFRKGSTMNNTKLSKARAETIKNLISKNNTPFNASKIQTTGAAETECNSQKYPAPNASECRRVNVQVLQGACKS